MYLKKIFIENLRVFNSLEVEFSPNINLVLGPNNSGKSSLIKSIYRLQESNQQIKADDIRHGTTAASILYQISDLNDEGLHTLMRSISFQAFKELSVYIRINISHQNVLSNYLLLDYEADIQRLNTSFTGGLANNQYIPIPNKEDQNSFIYPFFAKRKQTYYTSNGGTETSSLIFEDLRNLPLKILKLNNGSHIHSDEYKKHCREILGFEIGTVPGEGKQDAHRIGIYTYKDLLVPIESMGEGVVNIIGLIALLLTEDNKLYLIEELENDIHPEALKKLLDLIISKSRNNQFIISTHSNIVLKHLGSLPHSKIFYVDPLDNLEVKKHHSNVPTSQLSEVENIPEMRIEILEKLGYDFFDFDLYKGYLILEESSE
jgi:predicted ATP-dependent endonuclease of OLD family